MQMEASECTMCTSPAAPTDHHSVLEWQLARLVGLQQHSAGNGNGNGNAIDHSKGGAKAITGSSSKKRRKPADSTKPAMVDATTTNASGNEIMASTATPNPNSSSSGKKKAASSKESTAVPTSGTPPAAKPDYIHVRARRGQATDSHSLAERVRRERISERMRYLQGLVPGCSKSTGKAGMLDEIINYVQSLQRQVEFLSMKLAFVNPLMDSSTDDFMSINPVARVEAMSYLQVSSLQQAELPHQVIDPFPGSCLSVHGSNSAWSVSLHKNYALETQQSRGATMPSQFSQCI